MRITTTLAAAVTSLSLLTAVPAQAAQATTSDNLLNAMRGEAFASAKYTLFGEAAQNEGYPQIAQLFADTAEVERNDHFAMEAERYGLVKDTASNLAEAIAGENYENTVMYPSYAAQAYKTHQNAAGDQFMLNAKDEGIHRDKYAAALADVRAGHDTTVTAEPMDPVTVTPGKPEVTGKTYQNALNAMHGEAFAWLKYALYAEQAKADGFPKVAELFAKTSTFEFREHFSEEANMVGLVGSTKANLRDCIKGEQKESKQMYPSYARQAEKSGDTATADMFREIAADEAAHHDAFVAALKTIR